MERSLPGVKNRRPMQSPPQKQLKFLLRLLLKILVSLLVLVFFIGVILLIGVVAFVVHDTRGTKQILSSSEVGNFVASRVETFKLFGVDGKPLQPEITGIQGIIQSDGFHGDGTDWFEVKLSPEYAKALRAALPKSSSVAKDATSLPSSPPAWWPTMWPPNTHYYSNDYIIMILPDSGIQAWFTHTHT